jgi:SPP1 family phage portal protein
MPSVFEILEKHKEDSSKLIQELCVDTKEDRAPGTYREEYDGSRTRRTKSVGNRLNKTFDVMQENEEGTITKTGEKKTVYVAKLIFPFPQKIVRTAVHFLFGGKMKISSQDNTDAFNEFTRVWSDELKMQNKLKRFARYVMTETKAALLFYPQPISTDQSKILKLRCMILHNENGEFYPHFDDYGDMDAFIRRYSIKKDNKDIEQVDLYLADKVHKFSKESGSWEKEKVVENRFKKIPVIYAEQDLPEWEAVTSLIDNFEMRASRLADTNDYFAEPLLKLFGNVKKAPGKDEVGKVIEFEMHQDQDGKMIHGDADYATWDHTPESIKLDLETTWDGIFAMTSTPDLSFNNIKGIGNVSGVALKLMFLDALIKKEEKAEIFYDALKRCVSVVVAGITGYTNVKLQELLQDQIDVSFTDQLPADLAEMVDTLVAATGGKPILSQESGTSLNPLVRDPDEEINRLQQEKSTTPNESFNL